MTLRVTVASLKGSKIWRNIHDILGASDERNDFGTKYILD